MQSLPLTTERQQTEWKTIKSITQSNNFPDKIITKRKAQLQQKSTKNLTKKKTETKNGQSLRTIAQE
jgi:hypothetical protein